MGVNHGSVTNHFHIPIKETKDINPRRCKSTEKPNSDTRLTRFVQGDQPQAHYIIPSLENRHFTGREFTLDQLRNYFYKRIVEN